MKLRTSQWRDRRERYGLLLAAILAAFTLQGIATPAPWEQVLVTALLAATLLLALWAADARDIVVRISLVVGIALFLVSVVEALAGNVDVAATRLANLLLLCLAPPAVVLGIVRSLRARGHVTVGLLRLAAAERGLPRAGSCRTRRRAGVGPPSVLLYGVRG